MAQTFSAATVGTWQEIVSGATFRSFGVQIAGTYGLRLAIATAVPSNATEDFIALDSDGDRSFSCELEAADRVYMRASTAGRQAKVRGYRVAR